MNKVIFQLLQKFVIVITFSIVIVSCKYIPVNRFAFSPTPQNGHSGGISGVYVNEVFERCGEYAYSYGILQFYDDGTVLYVSTCSDGDIASDWIDIKKWFNRNNDKIEISRGKYFISQEQIWFSTTAYNNYDNEIITVDYSGTYKKDKLVLSVYSHFNGNKEEDREYLKINVEQ
jgi:hypothetical protein